MSHRNSNIELLRIVAMLMILILHADFFATNEPTTDEAILHPVQTFSKVFFEMFSLISVNLFVLISGWFSIKFTFKGLANLVFQSIFIITLMYIIGLLLGFTDISKEGLLECVFMGSNAWFVKAYIGLYILAPILNTFIERTTKRQLELILITFYIFQTLYGCLLSSAGFIAFGNSTFSFIGLYLLARYMRIYGWQLLKFGLQIWFASLIIAVLWYFIPLYFGILPISYMALHYSSPTTIIGALGLLLWAANRKPTHSSFINYIAASCFSVYLYHICNQWTTHKFSEMASHIYSDYSGIRYLIVISGFIISAFIGGILVDQLRKFCWQPIAKRLNRQQCVPKRSEESILS